MSGCSDSGPCPVCGNEMSTYSDYKPFDSVGGRCIYCGFTYYTKVEQLDLEQINELREEHNEDCEEKGKLKPLTREEFKKWEQKIEEVW